MEKSKQELLSTVLEQEETIKRYKSRLQDIVTAHKRLISEKQSLEECLKITLQNNTTKNNKDGGEIGEDMCNTRLDDLTQSVLQISAEKSKTEQQFQADRKKLLLQIKEQEDQLRDLENQLRLEKKLNETLIESTKTSVTDGQGTYDNVTSELQNLLITERSQKVNLERDMEKLKMRLNETNAELTVARCSEKNARIELEKLQAQEKKENSVTEKLKRELKNIQDEYHKIVQKEKTKEEEAEDKYRQLMTMHEKRVSKLEDQLAELTTLVNAYDRKRHMDQEAIQAMKNRLLCLEMENVNNSTEADRECSKDEILARLDHLKHQLMLQCKRPQDFQDVCNRWLKDFNFKGACSVECVPCATCKVKLASVSTLDDKSKQLENDWRSLRDRVTELETNNASMKTEYEKRISEIQIKCDEECRVWKERLSLSQSDSQTRLKQLQEELLIEKQRLTNTILEKDEYIEKLKAENAEAESKVTQVGIDGTEQDDSEILPNDGVLLHHLQEKARRSVDMSRLKQENRDLEMKLHEQRKLNYQCQQQYEERLKSLQDAIRRLERCSDLKQETNIEYLKNIVLKYLITMDENIKSHMLTAIGTVLHFTDDEVLSVIKAQRMKINFKPASQQLSKKATKK